MPDFDSNWTPRAYLRYSALGVVHTLKVRQARGSNAAAMQDALDKIGAVLSANPEFRYSDWAPLSAGWIQQDSGLSLPLSIPTISAGVATPPTDKHSKYIQVRFEGRSADGLRGNITLFGCNINLNNPQHEDLRVLATEANFPTALWVGLSEVSPAFTAINGSILQWYPYFNIKQNDHFMNKVRP